MGEGAANGADTVRWDLRPIYRAPDDPAVARDEAEIDRLVAAFQAHRDLLSRDGIKAEEVAGILKDLERIRFLSDRLVTYAELGASADQEDAAFAALLARFEERQRRWSAQLVFVELELRRLTPEIRDRLIENPALARYRHYIQYQAALAPHTLSEVEEQVALKKNIAGRDAQVRFREEYAARLDFGTLVVDGEERPMTHSSLISLQENPDPQIRFQARSRLLERFRSQLPVFAFLYGSVVKDHSIETELRSYSAPIEVENVPNEIPSSVVHNLLEASHKYLPVLHDYYGWKGAKLQLPRLRTCDLMAPLPGVDPAPISWSFARRSVQEAFSQLGPSFASEVAAFFDDHRLDAAARKGKRGVAFCAPVPGMKPYASLNYTGTLFTLITLAHELGHGIHFVLSGGAQTYLQAYNMSKVVAETASEFGECLLRDHLLRTVKDPALRRKILVNEVDRFIGVIFRQLFFTEFELAVHEKASKEPVSADGLCDLWETLAREHYGPNVDLIENDRVGWSVVGHFVFNPFYCYSYALSQVLVHALYRKWKSEREAFLPRLLNLLRGGSSETPTELLARAGIDLRSDMVLEEAFHEFEEKVEGLKATLD